LMFQVASLNFMKIVQVPRGWPTMNPKAARRNSKWLAGASHSQAYCNGTFAWFMRRRTGSL
jgi:hypothetical protein